jgi:flagella basal body P-ring formation protein FlgA
MKTLVLCGAFALLGCEFDRKPRVVGARRDLNAGTRVTLADIEPVVLSVPPRPTEHIEVERAARVIGATLAKDVLRGAPITVDDLAPRRPRLQRLEPRRGRGRRASAR